MLHKSVTFQNNFKLTLNSNGTKSELNIWRNKYEIPFAKIFNVCLILINISITSLQTVHVQLFKKVPYKNNQNKNFKNIKTFKKDLYNQS